MIGITEAARKLEISDTTLNRRLKKLSITKVKKGRLAYISEEDFEKVKAMEINPSTHSTPSQIPFNLEEVGFLREQLQQKDSLHLNQLQMLKEQLEQKDKQIGELQKSLDQEQQLSLLREKRIEELGQNLRIDYKPSFFSRFFSRSANVL